MESKIEHPIAMKLTEFLNNAFEEKNSEFLRLNINEVLCNNEETWKDFIRKLKQTHTLKTINLMGTCMYNAEVKARLKNLFFVLFHDLNMDYIYLDEKFVCTISLKLQKNYAKHIRLIQDRPPIFVNPKEVLKAYADDSQGLFIRQTPKSRFFADDWLSIINPGPKTRLLSATFVLQGVPIALIGQVPSKNNARWSDVSGILFSHTTECRFSGKSDMSTDLYYLIRTSAFSWKIDPKVLTPAGEIDYNKLYEKNSYLKEHGAKVKKNVVALRNKVLEQRDRIKSKSNTYQTTSGKQKENIEKSSVEEFGILINNEGLLAACREDIIGVYVNTATGQGINDALMMQQYLAEQGIHVGLFTYEPKSTPALVSITAKEILENPCLAEKLDKNKIASLQIPEGHFTDGNQSTTSFKFYTEFIAQSYQEYFSNTEPAPKICEGSLTFALSAKALLEKYPEQLAITGKMNQLAKHCGWISTGEVMLPGRNCLKVLSNEEDDLFLQSFFKRFFPLDAWSVRKVESQYKYQIDIHIEKAFTILSEATLQWNPHMFSSSSNVLPKHVALAK
jgi:hypothetical protein